MDVTGRATEDTKLKVTTAVSLALIIVIIMVIIHDHSGNLVADEKSKSKLRLNC